MGMRVFQQREPKIPGARNIGAAISGPRIASGNITDMRLFLNCGAGPESAQCAVEKACLREMHEDAQSTSQPQPQNWMLTADVLKVRWSRMSGEEGRLGLPRQVWELIRAARLQNETAPEKKIEK